MKPFQTIRTHAVQKSNTCVGPVGYCRPFGDSRPNAEQTNYTCRRIFKAYSHVDITKIWATLHSDATKLKTSDTVPSCISNHAEKGLVALLTHGVKKPCCLPYIMPISRSAKLFGKVYQAYSRMRSGRAPKLRKLPSPTNNHGTQRGVMGACRVSSIRVNPALMNRHFSRCICFSHGFQTESLSSQA